MSDSAQAALERARALRTAGRPSDVLEHLGPALANHGTACEAFILQASALADLGRIEEAIQAAKRAQAQDPHDEHAFRIEGLIRINKLKGAGAEPVLRESVRLSPNLPNLYLLVHALRGRWQRAEARSIATRLVAEFPHDAQAFDALGVVELRERRWPQAEAMFRRAAELEPHEALYAARLGTALQAQGKTESAADAYLAAARSDPVNPAYRRRLGRVGLSVGAAGLLTVGKLGLLPVIAKGAVIVGALHLSSGTGGGPDAKMSAELVALWSVLMVLVGTRLGYRALRLRRGIAVLPASVQSELSRDNRRALGGELLALGLLTSVLALWMWAAVGWLGIGCLIISLTVAVAGWRMDRTRFRLRNPRVWLSALWPPSLAKVPLSVAIGSLFALAIGVWVLAYAVVLPGFDAPPPLTVSAVAAFGWLATPAVLVPLVAAVRGVIRGSVNARQSIVICAGAAVALVALLEGLTAFVCFIAQPPNQSTLFGIIWIGITLATVAATPSVLSWARRVRAE